MKLGRDRDKAGMMSDKNRGHSGNPWSFPVVVAKIPDGGSHVTFEADASQRDALAVVAGVRDVQMASATFDLAPPRGRGVHVTGRVKARIGQVCVVTLEPLDSEIDEEIEAIFAEPDSAAAAKPKSDPGEEEPDPPELIVNGVIDLGKLAADMFFLGIDPYPRKPAAVFEADGAPEDPEDHPFAALKALKQPRS
jgi:uncharacterized metal-binding protein YceD (DUF177 family)